MSIVVTGTDTEVGKTVVSGLILARYGERYPLAYWKPVATGAAEDRDSERVRSWVGDSVDVLPETYLWEPPVSPHLAARLAGERVEPERILGDLVGHGLARSDRNLLIEGIGGLLVPFTDGGYLFADLLRELCLPIVIVARSTLGTINHTLLTLEAARARSLEIAGVVLVGPHDEENRRAIERIGRAPIIREVERLRRVDASTVREAGACFDPRGVLESYFAS